MKILHIGDMAGIGATLSSISNKKGDYSRVVQDKNIETFYHGLYYKNTYYVNGSGEIREFVESQKDEYDHFVIHDRFNLAVDLDNLNIPSSYVFHGNMLRQQPELFEKVENLDSIENIFVTTEDMFKLGRNAELLYRPVDVDLFKPLFFKKKQSYLCLTQERYKDEIRKIARSTDNGIFIMDRVKNVTPYEEMPILLNRFSGYIDLKFQPSHPPSIIKEMSVTGLQSLACGIPVFTWENKWETILPKANIDENSYQEFKRVILE